MWLHGCMLLAEHPDLRIPVVDIHSQVAELVYQFFQVLRLEMAEIEVDALVLQGFIHAYLCLGGDQSSQPYSGAKQLHRHPNVHLRVAVTTTFGALFHQHAKVLGGRLRNRLARRGETAYLLTAQRRQEPVRFLSSNLAGRKHLQYSSAFLIHSSS